MQSFRKFNNSRVMEINKVFISKFLQSRHNNYSLSTTSTTTTTTKQQHIIQQAEKTCSRQQKQENRNVDKKLPQKSKGKKQGDKLYQMNPDDDRFLTREHHLLFFDSFNARPVTMIKQNGQNKYIHN